MVMYKTSLNKSRRASALVITLALVVLLCIMVVGLTSRARLESVSSHAGLARVQSTLYTQAATDMALAKLRNVVNTNSTNFWASQPGRLITTTNGVVTPVDLSSGLGQVNAINTSVNLNIGALTNSSAGLITEGGDNMWVNWVYVLEDPTTGATSLSSTVPAAGAHAVGRFAYWVDDETAKVNLNTAGTRSASYVAAHPSQVDLSEVGGLNPSAVTGYRTGSHYFQTVAEAEAVSGASNAIANNTFSLTAQNMSPDLNMFGQPRIMLTTSQALANGGSGTNNTNYINILNSPTADPGLVSNLNALKVNQVLVKIANYLARKDWPIKAGVSFADKYKDVDPTELSWPYQEAANIIDYVRTTESSMDVVEPLGGVIAPSDPTTAVATASSPLALETSNPGDATLMGNVRGPVITEVGALASNTPSSGGPPYTFPVQVMIRLYLPPNRGLTSYNLLKENPQFVVEIHRVNHGSSDPTIPTGNAFTVAQATVVPPASTTITPGQSYILTYTISFTSVANSTWLAMTNPAGKGSPQDLVTKITMRLPSAPAGELLDRFGDVTIHTYTDPSTFQTISVNDPSVDYNNQGDNIDWVSGPSHLGSSTYVPTPSAPLTPVTVGTDTPQDQEGGVVTSAGVVFPNQVSAGGPGYVKSVGELGYVHTGIGRITAGGYGVPWRTWHFQPMAGLSSLPDWAVMDLFSAPIPSSQLDTAGTNSTSFYIRPTVTGTFATRTGGRINLNNQIAPFATGGAAGAPARLEPLEAMLLGATSSSGPINPTTVAGSISQMSLPSGVQKYGGTNLFYYSPAQIVDVNGLATAGSESSEGVFRQIADLATTRSYVYSIYSVGQAIKQDTAGNIHVLGEHRQVSTYEYSRSGTNSGGQQIPLDFQCIYSQDLTP